jgi:hypothetical protein
MKKILMYVALLIGVSGLCLAQDSEPPTVAPAWFIQEIATLTAGSGRWIADNSAYKSEQEPYEAYGTEWIASFDGTTMSGRLFGIKDGEETANFWEFRQYWHPGRGVAVVEQFGWGGTVGVGIAWRDGEKTRSDQAFFTPGGSVSRTGHSSEFPDSDTHLTESFDIEDEAWLPRRTYTWHRAMDTEN